MRKIREVLRLHFEARLSERQISNICVLGKGTVRRFLKRAEAVELSWPLPPTLDDAALEKRLFPPPPPPSAGQRPQPDYATIHKELRGANVTLQLLWEEYKQEHSTGYSYSRFSELYSQWSRRLDLVLRQDYRAGEKMFVDHAGQTAGVIDRLTGDTRDAYVFVAVLGASSYTYAEATWTRGLRDWISSHVRAFDFFQGCTRLVVPDNWKSGVKQPCYYEPELNRTYNDLALHYGVGILPARPYHARDKDYVSYCTLSCLCRGEDRLLGRSASLAFENGVLVQRLVETSPDIVVTVLLQQPLSSPSIDCSERHTVPHAHLFRRE